MTRSMWSQIRMASGKQQADVARELGVTRQAVNRYESGKAPVPIRAQIYYLQLRNTKTDKIIIEYLKEGLENGKRND